jgi:Lipopolysaccharide kinase (Kdo/WaaP) family
LPPQRVPLDVTGDYEKFRVGRTQAIARSSARDFVLTAIAGHGSLAAWAGSHTTQLLTGRTGARVIDAPDGPWVVRHYTRGGRVASALGDLYLRFAPPRPFLELVTSVKARAAGIATPEVMVATVSTHGLFRRGDIATRHVPESATLADITFGEGRWPEAEREIAWEAAGRCVRDAAMKGFVHADLNLRNILIAGPAHAPRTLLLDLDRCRMKDESQAVRLPAMVRRLHRSARRFVERYDQAVDTELKAFDRGIHD